MGFPFEKALHCDIQDDEPQLISSQLDVTQHGVHQIVSLFQDGAGRIMVVGMEHGGNTLKLLRFHENGDLDASFNNGQVVEDSMISDTFHFMPTITSSGTDGFWIYSQSSLRRYSSDGRIDPRFQQAPATLAMGGDPVGTLPMADGRAYVWGYDQEVFKLYRLSLDGAVDPSFDPQIDPEEGLGQFLAQPDGKLLWASEKAVRRLLDNGRADPAFTPYLPDSNSEDETSNLRVQTDQFGRIYIIASSQTASDNQELVRLNPDGTREAAYPNLKEYGGIGKTFVSALGEVTLQGVGKKIIVSPDGQVSHRASFVGSPDVATLCSGRLAYFSFPRCAGCGNALVHFFIETPDRKGEGELAVFVRGDWPWPQLLAVNDTSLWYSFSGNLFRAVANPAPSIRPASRWTITSSLRGQLSYRRSGDLSRPASVDCRFTLQGPEGAASSFVRTLEFEPGQAEARLDVLDLPDAQRQGHREYALQLRSEGGEFDPVESAHWVLVDPRSIGVDGLALIPLHSIRGAGVLVAAGPTPSTGGPGIEAAFRLSSWVPFLPAQRREDEGAHGFWLEDPDRLRVLVAEWITFGNPDATFFRSIHP
ncbi:MAG: hypothetical protein KF791_09985 [Verrucomicrobiae bacterium]|nr:hypothetical protein [Verrucomicrobiae bacterium]